MLNGCSEILGIGDDCARRCRLVRMRTGTERRAR